MKYKIKYILFLLLWACVHSSAQEVTISKEFNIRHDFGYEILGNVEDRILLYRDKHVVQEIEVFDNQLQHIYTRELNLEQKKSTVHGVTGYDTCFHITYSFADDSLYTYMRKYDNTGLALDTVPMFISPKKTKASQFTYTTSQDKNHSLLFYFSYKEGISLNLFDHANLEAKEPIVIQIKDRNDYADFVSATLTNEGKVIILFENYNRKFTRDKHNFMLISVDMHSGEFIQEKIKMQDWITNDLKTSFDELNNRFHITGLFNDKESTFSKGLFIISKDLHLLTSNAEKSIKHFDPAFLKELYKDQGKEKLDYHKIKDIRYSMDGSIILFTEYEKVFSRRTPFQGYAQNNSYRSGSGWMDHYLEEVLIFAIAPDGELKWKNLLLKKQFSQDDNGAFSSFFLFALPSRLMVIFNDDIRKNSLVSEFEVSPSGKLSRKSLLSTEDQELKLRFSGASQISNTSFIVPSEKNNRLRLVLVKYE